MAKQAGIRVRHGLRCRSLQGGNCNCRKLYEAAVYSARDGRKIRKAFPTEAAARQWRSDAASAINKGALRAPTATTLRQAAAAFLAGARDGSVRNRSGDTFKPSAIRSYDQALKVSRTALGGRSILEELGAHKLSEIGRVDLQDIADRLLAGGLDPSTVRNALMPLRAIYRRALLRNELVVNPTAGLELPASRGRRDRVASPAEAERLIGLVAERDRALWATAFYAGLRLGELLALRWEDIDLAGGLIRVERAYDGKDRRGREREGALDVHGPLLDRDHDRPLRAPDARQRGGGGRPRRRLLGAGQHPGAARTGTDWAAAGTEKHPLDGFNLYLRGRPCVGRPTSGWTFGVSAELAFPNNEIHDCTALRS